MTGQQYIEHMDTLMSLLRPLRLVPVNDMLDDLSRSEAIAPIVEPTAFQLYGYRLSDQRRVLNAVRQLQRAMDEVAGPIDTSPVEGGGR